MGFYLDTSVFIALLEKKHSNHGYAIGFANTAIYRGEKLYISSHVLDEALLNRHIFTEKYRYIASNLVLIDWPTTLKSRAETIARKHGLDKNDVLHGLIAKHNGIYSIASFDKDFQVVTHKLKLRYFNSPDTIENGRWCTSMLTYRELMRKRRKRRAEAMIKYGVAKGIPKHIATEIANKYLHGKITYGKALEKLEKLASKNKK